ncbi:unnamed protein product [Rotaria socialis]|uniref:Sperm-tail PG-rich repeat-containing protein 2 n=1 Tax=Rotaria socialis TaxID=392032 RepID=A0A818CAE0_9BILA|nr:unnamed protein product [Rotaria socialis]CAF3427840.1 unnamed protein product [Rotaria socialis]CAF3593928.1 unnamed protein product [Rotaria socialis]
MGGSTLANRASRFNNKLSEETPGPGAYELRKTQSARSTITDIVKQPRPNAFKYNRKSLPPSIPDPKLAYGFEEDAMGTLVPQQAPQRDASIGPAFYSPPATVEVDASKLYHGVHFGKYSGKRTEFTGKTGPGPGEYDLNDGVKLEIHHINMKTWDKRPELQVARYPDNLLKTATKESIPGPGQYSIKRELDPEPPKGDIIGLEFERPGFGSQTERFNAIKSAVPGPATYTDKVMTAFNGSQSKPTSLKRNPFNQTSARFVNLDYKVRSAPGPGQYRIPGFADENLRRAVVEGGKKPPFNIASVRRLNMARKDEYNTPGPSSYDIKVKPFKAKLDHPTSNFVSSTTRDAVVEDIPGPTAYDVSRAYQALTSQHRQPPRSKHARKRHGQFLSAAKRTFAGDLSIDTPGPGAYDGFINERARGAAPVRDSRFRHEISKVPGPADYELSPLMQDTVLRGTFNSTLNNPILTKLQNRALREEKLAAAALNSASITQPNSGTDGIGEVAVHS